MSDPIDAVAPQGHVAGVRGTSVEWHGVLGVTNSAGFNGVTGLADQGGGDGVFGRSQTGIGVAGYSTSTQPGVGIGVYGESPSFSGVQGVSHAPGHAAVIGVNDNHAVDPQTKGSLAGPGMAGYSDTVGVQGFGKNYHGVYGESQSTVGGAGVYGKGALAGMFEGNVGVTGNLQMLGKNSDITLANADGAEEFDIAGAEAVDPGTVMVLTGGGALHPSQQPYDKRVAGIVSGAGTYRPALVLDRQENGGNRQPIALFGKVFCKVDAAYGPVEIGDLLTTSPTPGHAMKAGDPMKAFGAVLGKALRPLDGGQGLIPVLVSLQ